MTTREEIYAAIRNADAAGDGDSVRKLGAYLATLPPATQDSPQHAAIADRINNDQISQDARSGPSFLGELGRQVGNLVAGGVRGAGSIGATLLYPVDKVTDLIKGDRQQSLGSLVTGKAPLSRNEERRQAMTNALGTLGADTESPAFSVGKLGGEIAGTAGAGGLVTNGLSKVPVIANSAPGLINAIRTAGMEAGAGGGATNALARAAGGAISGGVSAGLVDPQNALSGAVIGAAVPASVQAAGTIGKAIGEATSDATKAAARRLMQSAIKPTIAQLKSGDADTAVSTLLDYGINPNKAGVEKLRGLIDEKNAAIANAIGNSQANIDKSAVLNALTDVRGKFSNQVSPTADLGAIQKVADDFANHPNFPGATLPVQAAQEMKQGTYQVLAKKYGQLGSADIEAQKGLARGLKEQIAQAVPEVGPLNAEESRLITTLNVSERRALMELNKNPMGLATLAHNPIGWAAFMADKSALFKSLAARMVNASSSAPNALAALGRPEVGQVASRVAPVLAADQ